MSLRMSDKKRQWKSILSFLDTYWFFTYAIWWTVLELCQSQCPLGSLTFEKIAGSTLQGIRFVPLYKGIQGEPSLTNECLTRCKSTTDCWSLLVSYTGQNCVKSPVSSEGRRKDIVQTQPASATSYFERICLSAPRCQRLWTFERVIGFEIAGFDDRTIPGVLTRLQCQDLCLRERGFLCRSGEYDYSFQECRLSSEDRRSQPSSFRPAFGDVDYFENQCVPEGGSGCDYERKDDLENDRIDAFATTATEAECQQLCDTNQKFLCHSFSYRPSSGYCKMSSDDLYNMGPGILRRWKGSEYYQKSNCLDLKLMCTGDTMQLTLNTREPFSGRIYSLSQPYSCQTYGDKQTVTRFIMSVKGNCGIEIEKEGQLTNTVVIQYHPLIQQKGDRVIRLYCSLFEETNRTITKSFRVGPGLEPSATSIVNATAPTPNIRLRITDANGTDITGTRIGDPLYFRVEIDEDSVFGIFARSLTASNGRGDRQITLIDEDGCPTDTRIFPVFEKIRGSKSLQSRFMAFKFSGDSVVRFEVNIHFCLEECSSAQCAGGQISWGKKRRKREEFTEVPIVPDYPLAAAIVVEGSDVEDPNPTTESHNLGYYGIPEDELVCTTKIVVVVSALGALFLQLGLIAACATCLLLSRKNNTKRYKEDAASTITETLPPVQSEISHSRLR